MIATAPQRPIVQHVETTLQQLRTGNLHHGVRFAAVTAVAVLSVLTVVAISLDWYFGWLSIGVRWLVSSTALGVMLFVFAAVTISVVRSRRLQAELAEQADLAAPIFEERLQTIVGVQSSRIAVDRQMMNMVLSETETLYDQVDPADLAQRRSLRIPLFVIGCCGLLLVGMLVMRMRDTAILMARFVWPSTSLTRTLLAGELSDQVVATDETWTLSSKVERGSIGSVLMEQRLNPTETVHRDLEVAGHDGDEIRFMVARAKESFAYRLTAGDYRSDWANVIVAQRPRILGAELHVVPPSYMERETKHISKLPRELTVFKGSTVHLAIRSEGQIERAEWIMQPGNGTRSMFTDDSGFMKCSIQIDKSVSLTPRLVEQHGLENKSRRSIRIRAIEDKPPTINITKPSPDTAVRPDDTVRIEFDAKDDTGIQRAELVLYKKDEMTGKVTELKKVSYAIDPKKNQRRVRGSVDVDLSKLELKHGETINYRVDAYDRKQLASSNGKTSMTESGSKEPAIAKPKPTEKAADNDETEAKRPNDSGDANANQKSQPKSSSTSNGKGPKPNNKKARSEMAVPQDSGPKPSPRSLDVAKPSSSAEMKLKINQYAGSFSGQARRKLEIAIAPVLVNLKKWLTATEDLLGSVQVTSDKEAKWGESERQSMSRAIEYLEQSGNAVDELTSRTNGTPYAFVGLQISDIALTNIDPARSDALAALKTNSDGRDILIDNSRIQVQRALARLEALTQKFERERREQLLAEKIQEFQKVYRVYVENTLAKLQAQRKRINRIKREGVEFDLDEEYLKRLQEILEMRRELEAELARILSEDPRLLKRFSQSSRGQADNLRDQFSLLARRQFALTNLAGKLGAAGDGGNSNGLELRTLEVAFRLAGEFGDAADRFDTWMPLNETTPTPEVTAAMKSFREAASRGEGLRQSAIQLAQGIDSGPADYTQCLEQADEFASSLGDLRQLLIAMGSNSSNDEHVSNATNRLVEIGNVRNKLLAWRFQIDALAAGRRGEALAVDQHQLMIELHEYTDKMSTLPRQIAQLIPESNGTVPVEIAKLSEALLTKIDTGIEPTQLASTLALRKEDVEKAVQRMTSADAQFKEAEEIFDQLMIAIVEVLDQLPVNDPITSLLNDPTLEEILAMLEREQPLGDLLGLPNRPSNLRLIGEWMNSGRGIGGSGFGQGQGIAGMVRSMLKAEQSKRQKALQKFQQSLVAEEDQRSESNDGDPRSERKRWGKVVSELDEGLIQQRGGGVSEYYRSAIRQYFETLSSK